MQLSVNDKLHEVPFDLAEIPLGKYLDYYDKYGRELDKELTELSKKDYRKHLESLGASDVTADDIELHQSIDIDNHLDKEALSWFSFWTGHNFFEAQELPGITALLSHYRIFRYTMSETIENKAAEFPLQIDWEGEVWEIRDYKLNPNSDTAFNEVITSKEVMRQTHALGLGRWDALPYLCCVFLRKKDEPFEDELIAEGGFRMEKMRELPMLHALKVAFFLSICVSIWKTLSLFSIEGAPVTPSRN